MNPLDDLIASHADELHLDRSRLSPEGILKAIAHMESSYGARALATLHEQAYCYGGRYYVNSAQLQHETHLWGCQAHCSYGPWQLLYITAWEFGFRDDPTLLREGAHSLPLVIQVLNHRVTDKTRPESFFDTWNSGTDRDNVIPAEYISKAMTIYRSLV